jgi:hypothetical protein
MSLAATIRWSVCYTPFAFDCDNLQMFFVSLVNYVTIKFKD